MKWIAEFLCLFCSKIWKAPFGPTICPYCGSKYVEWTNFEKFREENPWHGHYPSAKR